MVTRRAILIGSSGGFRELDYLSGVYIDIENYSNFLKSKAGGQWKENEIIVLRNPTIGELKQTIGMSSPDYSFVVFTGHGLINSYDKEDKIYLMDGDLSIQELVTKSHKQVIIIDAARKIENPIINGEPITLNSFASSDGIDTRNLFDESIAVMPNGILLIFSTQINSSSGDDKNLGGYFSYSFIKSGFNWWSNRNKGILRIDTAIIETEKIIKSFFLTDQKPVMAGQTRRLTFPPFAFGKIG